MKRERIFRLFLSLTLCLALAFSTVPLVSRGAEISFVDEIANALREAMVQRRPEFTYTYESQDWIFSPEALAGEGGLSLPQGEVEALLSSIYERAIAHTGAGNQGDYLRWHIQACEEGLSCGYSQIGTQKKDFKYTFTFALSYYTTAQQEAEVTAKVQSVLSQLNLAGKTDYEKIKAIYDYICHNVVYDYAHLGNCGYTLQYTAYGALIQGTSVCQGYSNLFYRMALEAGVDNRIITGQSRGEGHAWNIVKLGGVYYNLDSTWDAVTVDYRYFLKTHGNMAEHDINPEYLQPGFTAAYPMAARDYVVSSDPPPVTQPQTQPTTAPATQPATEPDNPATTQATTPATQPTTKPASTPTEEPTPTPPSGAGNTNPTAPSETASSAQTTDTQESSFGHQKPTAPEEITTGTWLMAITGVFLVAVAGGLAAIITRRRR